MTNIASRTTTTEKTRIAPRIVLTRTKVTGKTPYGAFDNDDWDADSVDEVEDIRNRSPDALVTSNYDGGEITLGRDAFQLTSSEQAALSALDPAHKKTADADLLKMKTAAFDAAVVGVKRSAKNHVANKQAANTLYSGELYKNTGVIDPDVVRGIPVLEGMSLRQLFQTNMIERLVAPNYVETTCTRGVAGCSIDIDAAKIARENIVTQGAPSMKFRRLDVIGRDDHPEEIRLLSSSKSSAVRFVKLDVDENEPEDVGEMMTYVPEFILMNTSKVLVSLEPNNASVVAKSVASGLPVGNLLTMAGRYPPPSVPISGSPTTAGVDDEYYLIYTPHDILEYVQKGVDKMKMLGAPITLSWDDVVTLQRFSNITSISPSKISTTASNVPGIDKLVKKIYDSLKDLSPHNTFAKEFFTEMYKSELTDGNPVLVNDRLLYANFYAPEFWSVDILNKTPSDVVVCNPITFNCTTDQSVLRHEDYPWASDFMGIFPYWSQSNLPVFLQEMVSRIQRACLYRIVPIAYDAGDEELKTSKPIMVMPELVADDPNAPPTLYVTYKSNGGFIHKDTLARVYKVDVDTRFKRDEMWLYMPTSGEIERFLNNPGDVESTTSSQIGLTMTDAGMRAVLAWLYGKNRIVTRHVQVTWDKNRPMDSVAVLVSACAVVREKTQIALAANVAKIKALWPSDAPSASSASGLSAEDLAHFARIMAGITSLVTDVARGSSTIFTPATEFTSTPSKPKFGIGFTAASGSGESTQTPEEANANFELAKNAYAAAVSALRYTPSDKPTQIAAKTATTEMIRLSKIVAAKMRLLTTEEDALIRKATASLEEEETAASHEEET